MIRSEVQEVNKQVDKSFYEVEPVKLPEQVPSIFSVIHDYTPETVGMVLGAKGLHFLQMSGLLDLTHPDLIAMLPEGKQVGLVAEALKMASVAADGGCHTVVDHISKGIAKEARILFGGFENMRHFVRLLLDPNKRKEARHSKLVQSVRLRMTKPTGISSLSLYVRYNRQFDRELKEATEKAEKYRRMGCVGCQLAIMKTLESCRSVLDESHCGFHRLTITDASMVLARVHKCETKGDGTIVHPKDVLPEGFKPKSNPPYYFCARAYPVHRFGPLPERLEKMIAYTEALPEKGNRPIFDHFLVLVPGVNMLDLDMTDKQVAEMDYKLTQAGKISPIILGERAGKCYFISYWG